MKYFFYIGVLSTTVDYSIFSIMIYLELASYNLAIIFGYTIGFVISFYLTRRFAFKSIRIKTTHYELLAVILVTLLGLLLNLGIVNILLKYDINGYTARIISISIVFFFNYFIRKNFIYA